MGKDIDLVSKAGNITIDAKGGEITITGKTKIVLDAPEVENKSSKFLDFTGVAWKTFGTKLAAGIHKTVIAAIKADYVHLAMTRTASKLDSCGVKVDHVGLASTKRGVGQATEVTSIRNGAFRGMTFGLTKL